MKKQVMVWAREGELSNIDKLKYFKYDMASLFGYGHFKNGSNEVVTFIILDIDLKAINKGTYANIEASLQLTNKASNSIKLLDICNKVAKFLKIDDENVDLQYIDDVTSSDIQTFADVGAHLINYCLENNVDSYTSNNCSFFFVLS